MEPTGKLPVEYFIWNVTNTNDGPPSSTGTRPGDLGIPLKVKVNTNIKIFTQNEQIPFRQDFGQTLSKIQHTYSIKNAGLVNLRQAKILIQWPEFTSTKPKMQLLKFQGPVKIEGKMNDGKLFNGNVTCRTENAAENFDELPLEDNQFRRVDKDHSGLVDYVSFFFQFSFFRFFFNFFPLFSNFFFIFF